jgi:N4-gp56 family major capsid protein
MICDKIDLVALTFDLQFFADSVIPPNAETNMMTSSDANIDVAFQKANDQKFLEIHKESLIFEKYTGKVKLRAHSGNTVRFPKKHRITPKNTLLKEGKTPDPNKIQLSAITATVEQHGDYIMFTDVALGTSIYELMSVARSGQAYESAEIKNALIRDDILANDSIQVAYADKVVTNGTTTEVSSVSAIDETAKLTVDTVRKMIRIMKKNNIKPIVGKDFVMMIHPDQWYDLTSDPKWEDMHKHTDPTPMYDGEIGRISGMRFVETTTVLVTKDGEAGGTVYHSLVLGAEGVDEVEMEGGGVKTIAKGLGSGGTADPLNQRATVGWKMFHGLSVKDPLAVIELMTGATDSDKTEATDLVTSDWE